MRYILLILGVVFLFFGVGGLIIIAMMDLAPFLAIGLWLLIGVALIKESRKPTWAGIKQLSNKGAKGA